MKYAGEDEDAAMMMPIRHLFWVTCHLFHVLQFRHYRHQALPFRCSLFAIAQYYHYLVL